MQLMFKIYITSLLSIYLLLGLPFILLSQLLPYRIALPLIIAPIWKGFAYFCLKILFRSSIKVIDKRENFSPPSIYIANHSHFIDIPLILTQVQAPTLLKKEILKIPLFRTYILASKNISVDRKDPLSRKAAKKQLKEKLTNGFSIQYYPEGTRSKTGKPKAYEEIKTSLMRYAYEHNIPVIPLSLFNTTKVLNKDLKLQPGVQLGLFLDKEVSPKDFKSSDEFCRYCWQQVQKNYQYLQDL